MNFKLRAQMQHGPHRYARCSWTRLRPGTYMLIIIPHRCQQPHSVIAYNTPAAINNGM